MSRPFRRGDSPYWWISFYDASGKRCSQSTKSTDEKVAQAILAGLKRQIEAQKRTGDTEPTGPLTLRRYVSKWLKQRSKLGIRTVGEDEDRFAHVLPTLGDRRLGDITRFDVLDLVRDLRAKGELSPRTILHVYAALRVAYNDAVADGLVLVSPCTLTQRRNELPRRADKDPAWRATAVFARDEVESLISDPRIPEQRRMLYGLLFLAGLRINEATPRRWQDYDARAEPLGRLVVDSHYIVKTREVVPGTKTGAAREVPVHPTLAKMLAAWKLGGWAKWRERQPQPTDLIVPATAGGVLNSNSTQLRLNEDLAKLGLRARRQHDARRTFISLARAEGALPTLKWATHGAPTGVYDSYTSPSWGSLCAEVSKLNISLREGQTLKLASGCYAAATSENKEE